MTTRHIGFRLLRKLKVLPYLNVSKAIWFADSSISIPVLNGLGYPNLFLQPNWLHAFINGLLMADNQTFIDVGANIGQTLIAVKAVKRPVQYVGFEPSISCCYYLKKLIQANNFSDCRVYNFALSDTLKETLLETNAEADPTGSIITALRPAFFSRRESVTSIDYDRLLTDQKVTCVKIDVEGGELETLLGMQNLINRDRPYVLCEVLDSFSDDVLAFTQQRADQVCNLLRKHDYGIIQLVQNETTDLLVSFDDMPTIRIVQWGQTSLQLNDYLFYPHEQRQYVVDLLTQLCR